MGHRRIDRARLSVEKPMGKKYPPLLSDILSEMLFNPHLEKPNRLTVTNQWRLLMKDMIGLSPLSLVDSTTLHAKWTESVHRIRELVDYDHLLLDMLRV